jgi:hypothetical protein
MHMNEVYSSIVSRLEDEISAFCKYHIRNFPYHLQVHGGTYEGSTTYSFAWSLDKGGYKLVSKLYMEFLPDTYHGCVMVSVRPERMRRAIELEPDWDNNHENPYSDKWRYDRRNMIITPDPIMIITLLEAHADHNKLIQSVHEL